MSVGLTRQIVSYERAQLIEFAVKILNLCSDIGKLLHAAVDRTEPERLSVTWKVDCGDKSIVHEFNVTVCKGDAALECVSHFTSGVARGYMIEGLKPFTLYKVLVSMISTSGKRGVASEVHEKTAETGECSESFFKCLNDCNS